MAATFAGVRAFATLAVIAATQAAAPLAVSPSVGASYRKDAFLPYSTYPEAGLPDPSFGGRMHIVSSSLASGAIGVSNCSVNGVYANMSTGLDPATEWPLDWIRTEPSVVVAGDPVWISFHSRSPSWDALANSSTPASIICYTAGGDVWMNASFPVYVPLLPITYVTTGASFSRVVMHVMNNDSVAHTARAVVFNGVDITSSITNGSLAIPPGATAMWLAPAPVTLGPGSVWTLTVAWTDATRPSAAGGQLYAEFFPIESWVCTNDCPFPTVNDWGYAQHRSHGVDTFFLYDGSASDSCAGPAGIDILNKLAPQYGFYVLASPSATMNPSTVTNASGLAGWFLSDEGDQNIDDGLRQVLSQTVTLHQEMPTVPTYAGGSRNRYSGIYSGITDIKGLDFYIAACAPHVTNWGIAPPLRGSYDYIRNTRNNHMPLATWTYSQVFDNSWDSVLGVRQPDAAEIAVSVMSVVASGAKGVTLFQTNLNYWNVTETMASVATLGNLLRETTALREVYREGDITGMVTVTNATGGADTDVIAELIHSPRALVLILINIANNGGYSDLLCGIGLPQHWNITAHTCAAVQVTVPAGVCIVDSFQLQSAAVVPGSVLPPSPVCGPTTFTLNNVLLGADAPSVTGTWVFATDMQLRNETATALLPWNGPTAQ